MKISAQRFMEHERELAALEAEKRELFRRVDTAHNRITGLRMNLSADVDLLRWQLECVQADLYFLARRSA